MLPWTKTRPKYGRGKKEAISKVKKLKGGATGVEEYEPDEKEVERTFRLRRLGD